MQARGGRGSDLDKQDTYCSGSGDKNSPSSNMHDRISIVNLQNTRARFGSELGKQDATYLDSGQKGDHLSNVQDMPIAQTYKSLQ